MEGALAAPILEPRRRQVHRSPHGRGRKARLPPPQAPEWFLPFPGIRPRQAAAKIAAGRGKRASASVTRTWLFPRSPTAAKVSMGIVA